MTDTAPPEPNDPLAPLTLAEEHELYEATGHHFADYPLFQDAMLATTCYQTLRDIPDSDLIAVANGEPLEDEETGGTTPASEFLEQQIKSSYAPGMRPAQLATATRERLKSIKSSAGNYTEYYGYIAWLLERRKGSTQSWPQYWAATTFTEIVKTLWTPASLPPDDDQPANTDINRPTGPAHSGPATDSAEILNITQPGTKSENTGGSQAATSPV